MHLSLPAHITIKEVGPRDGLQNEKDWISTEDKIAWINHLSQTGLKYIEITSFVNPKWIPQLADSRAVATGITRAPGVTYTALVPNMRGLQGALASGVDEIAVFMSASEGHNQNNINKTIAQTFPVLAEVVQAAEAAGVPARGYVSTVFGCPYDGATPIENVIRACEKLFEMGIRELSLGDTIGVADPALVRRTLDVLVKRFPADKLALHYHDTHGMALANVLASLDYGITVFDGALGGLGGCPYAAGASGNVATDDLVHMLGRMGIATGVDQAKLVDAAMFLQERISKALPSKNLHVHRANMRV
jgi:hydroxymethylglutaryl-CoA lyase